MAGFEGYGAGFEVPGPYQEQAAGLAQQRLWQSAQIDQQYGWPETSQSAYQADYWHRTGTGLRPSHDAENTFGDPQNYSGPIKTYHGMPFGLDRFGNWFPLQQQQDQSRCYEEQQHRFAPWMRRERDYYMRSRFGVIEEFPPIYPQEPQVAIPRLATGVPMAVSDWASYPVDSSVAQVYGGCRDAVVKIEARSNERNGYLAAAQLGTGFFVNSDGELATDFHVIKDEDPNGISVTTTNGRTFHAHIEACDQTNDLALLKVDAPPDTHFPAIPLGTSYLSPGSGLMTLGHPQGKDALYASPGAFLTPYSYQGRPDMQQQLYAEGQNPNRPFLLMNMHTEHGDSGGPVINSAGQVVGLDDRSNQIDNTYATPVECLENLIAQYHQSRAWLG